LIHRMHANTTVEEMGGRTGRLFITRSA
jgi:hypothetical protein